ncbi:uncharacterized protein KGF55_001238 [Candida pseudojiufengensis]|uniref:uncharacterized protein n=1 Tax=Candida pseudojiufengensis TaxID=497109 RepID=UPI002224F2C3|nr:uncharacterized protein KGF55_001238 [Candida pseudojiufengensis]KAI5965874.1 hypothetical protein KGF55_001238 [Candida pseudojiufengensis]
MHQALYLFSFFTLATTLIPPHLDEFYKPPKNYNSTKLGEILKIRPPPGPIRSYFAPIDAISWQILVRSENSDGEPICITMTLLEPANNPDTTKILSYQPFENSAMIDCSPSFALLSGAFDTFETQCDLTFISMALTQGWVVIIPDYEGPNSVFPVAKDTAFAVLNCMRAAKTFFDEEDIKFGMMGYSGGAFTSAWASIYQPTYAPELNLVGAALGGLIPNITALIENVDGGPYAGLIVNILNGLSNEYPQFKNAIHKYGPTLKNYCLFSAAIHYFGTNFNEHIYKNFINDKVMQRYFKRNDLLGGKFMPEIPIFIFHSKINEMSPIDEVHKLITQWCENGVKLEFAEDLSYNHMVEAFSGIPASIIWLSNRFNDEAISYNGNCHWEKRISNLLYPGATTFIKEYLKLSAKQYLSKLPL